MEGLITQSGLPFDSGFLGYQIVHKQTKRIFPQTNRFQVYTEKAVWEKIEEVQHYMWEVHGEHFDIKEYELEPMYEEELKGGWHLITHPDDWNELLK